jgi:glycosyltransferase involved in cell wall biosynthesis
VCREELARKHGLERSIAWLAVAAMMRPGDKLASYGALARALGLVRDLPWRLLVAGDGPARAEVEAAFAAAIPGRAAFLGALSLDDVAAVYAAADICVWPAVNEAYGMAMLEAQAAGVPVVSCATRGVPDVVEHGRTGLLAAAGDESSLAGLVRELLLDEGKRSRMSAAAVTFAAGERSIESAAVLLGSLLARFAAAPA